MNIRFNVLLIAVALLTACSSTAEKISSSVELTMRDITGRLGEELTEQQEDSLDQNAILGRINEEEKKALSTQYWRFNVNVPVIVSVMRDRNQKVVPFWLEDSGFEKTDLTVSNDQTDYDVWQKAFPKGEVGLGINGFDKHRLVYFTSAQAQETTDELTILPVFPAKQLQNTLDIGEYTYLDWDQLVLTAVPERMQGQTLLTTFRGRAREAHLIHAFRETKFPSSKVPDQVLLTWESDPSKSVVVQWRNAPEVQTSSLRYWEQGSQDTLHEVASRELLEDRLLKNDRDVARFRARLNSLKPGTTYQYVVESEGGKSPVGSFTTAGLDEEFSFIWFGDTHNNKEWGKLLQKANDRFPEVAFYSIAGDLVNTGLHRDDWDELFGFSGTVFSRKPLIAVPGNHDSQDGLGASLYQRLLTYPTNGPEHLSPGLTYSITYKNALFLMLDVVSFPVQEQTAWIDQQLAASDAQWKFVAFHFPPYNSEESYPDIVDHWLPVFDKHQVDIVMNGHYHYYMRSMPMYNNKVAERGKPGTVYIMSIGAFNKDSADEIPEPYAAHKFNEGYLFQHVDIQGNTLTYQAIDSLGRVRDTFVINK